MNTQKPIPVVGQTLYRLNAGNLARNRKQQLAPCKVVAVGRKYFTVDVGINSKHEVQFHLDTWREKTQYCSDYALYETEKEWMELNEHQEIVNIIREKFQYSICTGIPLESLRKIKQLLCSPTP